jgi:hypothetical protein
MAKRGGGSKNHVFQFIVRPIEGLVAMKRNTMRTRVSKAAAGLLALTCLSSAHAQTPAPQTAHTPLESVTVRAQRVESWNYSAGFVQSLLRPSFTMQDQFAKWKHPVCPRVKGMSASSAQLIEQRIREVAKKIGAPLDQSEACAPNIMVVVSQEPQAILEGLKDKDWPLFASTPVRDMKMRYPVQVWYYSVNVDYSGRASIDVPPEYNFEPPTMAANSTRLYTGIQPETRLAAIIADSKAIRDMALGTFADYVALLTLAQTPVTGQCQPAPSIANLFLADCAQGAHTTGLSAADLAMLTGIYQTPDTPERLQKVRIIANMRKNLELAQQK